MARQNGYSALQILLHWSVAVLVLAAYILGDGMGKALDQRIEGTGDGSTPIHVWLGIAAFIFILIRIAVRLVLGAPGQPAGTPDLQAKAAAWGHGLLYVLMVAVPIGGLVTWFLKLEATADFHEIAGNALLILAGAHAAVGIFHGVVKKDGVLQRMMKPAA